MVMVYSHGLMVQNTEDNGSITRPMVRVHSGMQMETAMMGNLNETNPMDMESTLVQMELFMKVYGLMTYNMDRVKLNGQMGQSI